ncbi:glycoside hydrolase family 3 domain protein [Pseudopedobacter saltans DSM 12145]|uniref:beta-N-acetylhexosaminidase n=1 Tax=Pseudopedobacter saltans (strain ATCC 51119 / DSM 12145 / JCM 21818 / CCUG 39354 / LMG 10337 / NBRC 100064 / NCIMB 13643) TaxID=762903 RepID=F0S8B1_PSESL|nr:glycoside hydrolase family 3 N-terminal domain-containing protein [Pseudopedobacter saltans]ADY53375.1 glycoside hydrolase family 3 domain protein [Pseudopedobacter saltans DSM 12145]
MKKTALVLFLSYISICGYAQKKQSFIDQLNKSNPWVDSVYNSLSNKEKLGQLFMLRAHSDKGKEYADKVAKQIKDNQVGGLVFFQGGPVRQAILTNQYQKLVPVPLMIAMDAEWGLGMRLDSTISYPYQMTLGAIQNNQLLYKMGEQVAKDFKRIGMQMNFAPVVDINNNPNNPVINYRSFGENKYNVADKGVAYMKGMQDNGIFTTAKHFPGHGDTDVDSHYDLPQIPFSKARLDTLEMFPFKKLMANGATGVMVGHMNIPALDPTPNLSSSLSRPIVTGILKNDFGFKGLVVSDAMEMKGAIKYFPNGQADVKALFAGLDVIELSEDTERAIKMLKKAIRHKEIPAKEVEAKIKKVLAAKYWMGLNNLEEVNLANLYQDLNRAESKNLIQQLADASVTVLKSTSAFPLRNDFVRKTVILNIGSGSNTTFSNTLKKIKPGATVINIPKNINEVELGIIRNNMKPYDQIIMAIIDNRLRPAGKLDFSSHLLQFVSEFSTKNTITALFANPYTITEIPGFERSASVIIGYQNLPEIQLSAAKVILGAHKASGKLPVSINAFFKYGDGIQMK